MELYISATYLRLSTIRFAALFLVYVRELCDSNSLVFLFNIRSDAFVVIHSDYEPKSRRSFTVQYLAQKLVRKS